MNFSWHTRILLAVTSGVALAFSFPSFNFPLLAWIAVGMLVLASCGAGWRMAGLCGFLHGFVFIPITIPWVDTVMMQYGGIDIWSAAGIVGLMALVIGLLTSIFSCAVAAASKK